MRSFRKLCVVLVLACAASVAQAATIKIATIAPEGSGWMREMRAGAEAIKTRTAGRVELKFYPGGVMGNDQAVLRKIKLGQLQGGAFTGAEMSLVYRDAQIYSLPFLFRNLDEVAAVRAKVDPMLRDGYKANGFVALGMTGGGFAYLMSTKAIKARDDLKSSKVWVPQSDKIAQITFAAGGVSPIALPLSDVYTALQTGMVETVGNTMSGTIAFQWHTRLKHLVDVPVTYVMGILTVDLKSYEKLSAEDQQILAEEVGKAFDKIDASTRLDNERARETLVKQGMEVFKPAADELHYWEQIGEDARKTMLDDKAFTPAIYDAIRTTLDAYRAEHGGAAQ
jgi:TRAP-type transport system periplasmic protein